MAAFDLADALSSPLCPDERPEDDHTLTLEEVRVYNSPSTVMKVASLLVRLHSVKKVLACCGEMPRVPRVCSTILDSLVEETIVCPPMAGVGGHKYVRTGSVTECTVNDTSQKNLSYESGNAKLTAVCLSGGHNKVNFKMEYYSCAAADNRVVLMTIANCAHLYCCREEGQDPQLKIDWQCRGGSCVVNSSDDIKQFLFFKRVPPGSPAMLESVKFPGWFISTSHDDATVEMCEHISQTRITTLELDPIHTSQG